MLRATSIIRQNNFWQSDNHPDEISEMNLVVCMLISTDGNALCEIYRASSRRAAPSLRARKYVEVLGRIMSGTAANTGAANISEVDGGDMPTRFRLFRATGVVRQIGIISPNWNDCVRALAVAKRQGADGDLSLFPSFPFSLFHFFLSLVFLSFTTCREKYLGKRWN